MNITESNESPQGPGVSRFDGVPDELYVELAENEYLSQGSR